MYSDQIVPSGYFGKCQKRKFLFKKFFYCFLSLIIEIKNSFSRITTDCIKIIFNKVKEPDLKISSLKAEMLTFLKINVIDFFTIF